MADKSPKHPSRYDELFEKYQTAATNKAGTRYEMLAALVLKALHEKHVVIHDLDLLGDSTVKHQIDVKVDIAGTPKRIIIECKDYDLSENKVGLEIVRNFFAVLDDTQADEAIVITCNGFTEDAQRYARSKGIKLAILRIFEEHDRAGRIEKVILNVTVQTPKDPNATVVIDERDQDAFRAQLAAIGISNGIRDTDPVFFVQDGERQQFNTFLTGRMNAAIQNANPNVVSIAIPPEGWRLQIGDNAPLAFENITVAFAVDEQKITREIVSNRVAELIFSGFGDKDLVIFGDQIQRYSIDPNTGAVSRKA